MQISYNLLLSQDYSLWNLPILGRLPWYPYPPGVTWLTATKIDIDVATALPLIKVRMSMDTSSIQEYLTKKQQKNPSPKSPNPEIKIWSKVYFK